MERTQSLGRPRASDSEATVGLREGPVKLAASARWRTARTATGHTPPHLGKHLGLVVSSSHGSSFCRSELDGIFRTSGPCLNMLLMLRSLERDFYDLCFQVSWVHSTVDETAGHAIARCTQSRQAKGKGALSILPVAKPLFHWKGVSSEGKSLSAIK